MGKLILNGIPYGNSEGKRGIAPYKETILYDATDATFKNITLSDSLLNYDAIIFHVHDTAYAGTNNAQQSGGYIYSRQDILGCMSSALKQIWLAGYGNTYATYTLTDETHLTTNTNVTSVCNRIIGVKYGKCDAQYIQGAELYSKDEEQIGVWIDKKPLYRKVYDFSSSPLNIPNNTWLKINNESGIQPIYGRGIITNSTAALELAIDVDPDGIYVRSYFTYSACDYIIIEYTKDSDAPGSGGYQAYGFSPVIYSEQEREVGVWTNGKPLYQISKKVAVPSNSYEFYDVGITNFEECIDYRAIVTPSNGGTINSIFYNRPDSTSAEYYTAIDATGRFFIRTYITLTNYECWITVWYTKTTDTPGSGAWTTSGVPAVHYTEDEQVIGTYLGKPFYQKTIHVIEQSEVAQKQYQAEIQALNAKMIFLDTASIKLGSVAGGIWINSPYYNSANYNNAVAVTVNEMTIVATGWNFTEAVVTVKYTKTTD